MGNTVLHATWGVRCFMQTALRRKTETGNEKDPSAALGMTKRERHISHSFSLRYGSQPPALRATSFQRKEGECPFPRNVISSESEKSFSFAVKKGCEERDHGKHRTLNDFIPYQEPTSAPSGHLLPKEGGRKKGLRVSS